MKKVTFDNSVAKVFVSDAELKNMEKIALLAKEELVSKTGAGNDYLGWIDLPVKYNKKEFAIETESEHKQHEQNLFLGSGRNPSYEG